MSEMLMNLQIYESLYTSKMVKLLQLNDSRPMFYIFGK